MIAECFDAIEPMLGTRAACVAVGRPRASHYRHQAPPRPRSTTPRPAPPNKLTAAEMGQILDGLRSPRFVDLSPAQVFHILLDEGRYLASVSTYYRLLRAAGEVRERRRQATHPPRVRPELVARKPLVVWSWDIERHEALPNPCGGERTPPWARRSGLVEAEGSLTSGTGGRVDSSPDKAGTGQHCQMVWVRQARRKGVREEPAAERLSRANHQPETWRIWAGLQRAPERRWCRARNSLVG